MSRHRFLRKQAERLRAVQEQTKAQFKPITAEEAREEEQRNSRPSASDWQSLIEQRIQAGIEQGVFSNLPGSGKPLNLADDESVPEHERMGFRLLRSNGLAPRWIEVYKELQEDIERLERLKDTAQERWARSTGVERSQLREEFVNRIATINSKILKYNLLAPSSQVHLPLLLADDELAAFDAATLGEQR